MSGYLFIQSQDQFYDARTSAQYEMAIALADTGERVDVLLVQNAVLSARKGVATTVFDRLSARQIRVYADDLSLRQREIAQDELNDLVEPAQINMVIDAMLSGDKVVWW